MTDQEIKKTILKIIDKDKFGYINIVQVSREWGEDEKRVRLLLNGLKKKSLIKSRCLTKKMPSVNNFVLTDKGREYLAKSFKDE
ncbi:hypothetical protein E3J48_04535 [Candidatus Aerophobetes bacterium]|uniref:ArnR1-like winged helix-turn-helix domain-containing protein n=1 Tax=Aerophobetes bacterium TaxID=2030807 RepID=A0A523W5C9_UNCAE|nr:MAG: hypothetical protein E3J48_04535 [Candidatus Aerophobetes bacterium]